MCDLYLVLTLTISKNSGKAKLLLLKLTPFNQITSGKRKSVQDGEGSPFPETALKIFQRPTSWKFQWSLPCFQVKQTVLWYNLQRYQLRPRIKKKKELNTQILPGRVTF